MRRTGIYTLGGLGIGLLYCALTLSTGANWLGGEAATIELPHHLPQPPITAVLQIVPDAWKACDRVRVRGARACSSGTVITMESPCKYPKEVYARRQCHELKHVEDHLLKRAPWHGSDGRARD